MRILLRNRLGLEKIRGGGENCVARCKDAVNPQKIEATTRFERPLGAPKALVKPKLRGVFHEIGFYVSLAVGVALVVTAEPGKGRTAGAIFASCVAGCFGASALYHRPTWTPRARSWLARLDHAGVYLLIAGTYAPFGLIVLSKAWAIPILAIVWGGAILGILLKLFWVQAPKWLSAAIALTLGWVAAAAFPQLLKLPPVALLLVVVGGVLYTAGAIIYARRRPNPVPHVFGYHELFHVLTVAAAACQYAAIAFYVLPRT
jgi:hemolysin III